jgi:hypothetical protein
VLAIFDEKNDLQEDAIAVTLRRRGTSLGETPNNCDNKFAVTFKGILQKSFTTSNFAINMVHHDSLP